MVCTVKGGFTDLHPVVSGLNNGILLSMEAATEFMSLSRRNPSFSGGNQSLSNAPVWKEPLYLSQYLFVLTSTAPTCLRRQVDRLATR